MAAAAPLTITPEAARRLKSEADFSRAVLSIRHLLGCGGTGFRISVEENAPDEGHRFEAAGIPVVMDDHAFQKLEGRRARDRSGSCRRGVSSRSPRRRHDDFLLSTQA